MSLLALARAARIARPLLRPQQQLRRSSSGTAVADNTFVRERMAVKEHAAQTAGTCPAGPIDFRTPLA